jgi:hypothetical protein
MVTTPPLFASSVICCGLGNQLPEELRDSRWLLIGVEVRSNVGEPTFENVCSWQLLFGLRLG